MKRNVLVSLMIIGVVGAGISGTTMAMFNDTETSSNNKFVAGELDLKIDWEESYNGEHVETQNLTNNPGAIFELDDLKPGDWGEATVSLHLDDNPGWIWMNLNQTANWDNACTEPEHKAEGQCGSKGELGDELEFTIWADDGDNVLQEDEKVIFEGTAHELSEESLDEGILLDGNPSTNETEAFPGGETSYVGIKWELPLDTGNHIQGDSKKFDFSFYTEQKRHNEDPENPWGEDEEEEPENEPPVADFERANNEPLSTKAGTEVRLFSTSTDDKGITKKKWELGDGTVKFGQDVWHNWTSPGNYTVTLTVTDTDGETDSISKTMVVTGEESEECQKPVDSSKEYTADEISQAKYYGYDFDELSSETKCEVKDIFERQPFADGLEPEDVMTKDELSGDQFGMPYNQLNSQQQSQIDQDYLDQFGTDSPPEARFNYSMGNTVTFNAATSTDDNGISSYNWDLGDGNSATGQVVQHTYSQNGNYTVTLTVTDTAGQTGSTSQEIEVTS
jgi:predicted ribosomally synthesized peptide with SipW-like signal peptide